MIRKPILADRQSSIPFFLLLTYLLLEYGRPQALIPGLKAIPLLGATSALLALFLLFAGNSYLKEKETVFFLLLLGLMVIHGPIAVNNYWALMYFLTMATNFVVYLSLVHFVDSPEKYDRLVKTWLGIHLILVIHGIIKQGKGIGGFFGDENDLCMTLNMIIPFSFFLALSEKGNRKILYFGLTCVFLFGIIMTQSRGGFVGLIATFIYCWYRTKKKFVTAIVLIALALFAFLMAPAAYWDEIRSIGEEGTSKGTGEERMYTWGIGWDMFLDNPVMGVGQGNFPYEFREYEVQAGLGEEGYHGRSVAGRVAHSIYFTMLPELGIIGTGLFFGMVFLILKDLKKIKSLSSDSGGSRIHYFALALEGALVSYLVSGAFISVLYYPNFYVLMGFTLSLKLITERELKPVEA